MGLFDDFSRFLETRLDEFLRNNPHLELQAILEQIQEQEQDNLKLISQLQLEEKRLQDEILAVAKDVQTWHARISKAKAAGRLDLAQAAQEREASLLRKGNQVWGQMEGTKKRLFQAKELLTQIQQRKQEVKIQADRVKASYEASQKASSSQTFGWDRGASYNNYTGAFDPLEQKFQRWEMDEEIDKMKRNLGQ
ncbi:MAG: TIGR04376 family protein [Prochloraceae cyanobacterium]|nr:TIGR04376 family protein [Prochloraceae cyanobacterium]